MHRLASTTCTHINAYVSGVMTTGTAYLQPLTNHLLSPKLARPAVRNHHQSGSSKVLCHAVPASYPRPKAVSLVPTEAWAGRGMCSLLEVICHPSLMTPDLCNLGEEGFISAPSSRLLFITPGKSVQEFKAAGHVTPTVQRLQKWMQESLAVS